ncbi:MAG: dTDP-4-dehydrorhamnose 3,5-epimerase [marine bacterium B5-7]|nr:MAG: dTDP-4-dehydrorhamnose 3,5-epimerase [marine bacterium B5-7]
MDIQETSIPGVKLLVPRVFPDSRGYFLENYRENSLGVNFVQDNFSHSTRGAIRGMHVQSPFPQAKMVFVTQGCVLDIALDVRVGSPTFGQHVAAELSDENHHQLFIPEGFAHGFCVLSETADFIYKCSDYYHPETEMGIRFDDPDLALPWPDVPYIVSDKDRVHPPLRDIDPDLLPRYLA